MNEKVNMMDDKELNEEALRDVSGGYGWENNDNGIWKTVVGVDSMSVKLYNDPEMKECSSHYKLNTGDKVEVIGYSEDSKFYYVYVPKLGVAGWVESIYIR